MRPVCNLLAAKRAVLVMVIACTQQVLAQPAISSFDPVSGPVGTVVTIKGSNFDASPSGNTVYFGAAKAVVTAASNSLLHVIVPTGASYEPLAVTANGLTAYFYKPFNTVFPSGGFINQNSFRTKTDSVLLNSNQGPYGMIVKDFDGDGKTDVAAVNGEYLFYVLQNNSSNGNLSFTKSSFFTAGGPYNLASADFDGDGKPDLAVASYISRGVVVHRNTSANGTISFSSAGPTYTLETNAGAVGVGDFNNDGKPDIIAGGGNVLRIYKNTSVNGNISFALALDEARSGTFLVSDLNGDGKPEIVVKDYANTKVEVLKNTSTVSSISFQTSFSTPLAGAALGLLSDVSGDGKPELILIRSSVLSIYKNIGTADSISFATHTDIPANGVISQGLVCPSDIDGDGKLDLAYVGQVANSVFVLKNTGVNNNISFAGAVSYYTRNPTFVAAADLDGDHKPDLIASNLTTSNNASISVLKNQTAEPGAMPSGASPLSGNVMIKVSDDSSLQAYNGRAYVRRHYDIEPENNAGTATARVTLLFTQQDFNGFNDVPNHGMNLPSGPSDNAGKAALRILQYHGTSATGLPGSYSGSRVEVDPDDDKILWNEARQCWEVTFDVTGFSGFFVSTPANSTLPVKIISFTGSGTDQKNTLKWTSANETGFGFYEVQRSTDGVHFVAISSVQADGSSNTTKDYAFTDLSAATQYYYRLKAVDQDGSFVYSKVIQIAPAYNAGSLTIYPNPAKDRTVIRFPASDHSSTLSIVDLSGKRILTIHPDRNTSQYNLSTTSLAKGTYRMIWTEGSQTIYQTLVVE